MGKPIDGKAIAARIRARVHDRITDARLSPLLAAVLVGGDPASHLYVRLKGRACAEVGIRFEQHLFLDTTPASEIIACVRELAQRAEVDGILVQLPLPAPLDADAIIAEIPPEKDVDGFHPANVARLLRGDSHLVPPLGSAVLALLEATEQTLAGSTVALLANSETFCRPIEALLERRGMTVRRFAPFQPGAHAPSVVAAADTVISALGCGGVLDASYVRHGATLVDIGIATDASGIVRGDFAEDARTASAWYTPVPGGVGPVTVAMLLENVVNAAMHRAQRG